MLWPVLALVAVGFLISAPLTRLLITVGRKAGALDSPGAAGHHKVLRDVPNTGGLGIFLAVTLPMGAGLAAAWLLPPEAWQRLGLGAVDLKRVCGSTSTALATIAGMGAMCLLGSYDDRRPLGALTKLAAQVAVAALIVGFFDVRLLTLLGTPLSIAVTILWIIAVTNAVNFIDNMDGLAAGTCAIAASLFCAACVVNGQWFIAATLALLVGALCGFLVFNFPPARIFMGDGGSLTIGFLLAVLTARTTYWNQADPGYALGGGWYAVFMPVVVLAIPLYDLASVTLIRLLQRRNPMVGDQQHFSHRLVKRGLSPRGAVVVIWSLTAATGIGGVSLGRLPAWMALLVGVQAAMILLVIVVLEYASRNVSVRRDRNP